MKTFRLTLIFISTFLILNNCSTPEQQRQEIYNQSLERIEKNKTQPKEVEKPKTTTVSNEEKTKAYNLARMNPEVQDVAITQEGSKLNLVLVVKYNTSKERARQLGDNFLRNTMYSIENEKKPGKEIGNSNYDYLIGVYYPNEAEVAMGAKVSYSPRITW